MIEIQHYEITKNHLLLTSEEVYEVKQNENNFWHNVTKYTTSGIVDEAFVNEIAYLMVTLHRIGA